MEKSVFTLKLDDELLKKSPRVLHLPELRIRRNQAIGCRSLHTTTRYWFRTAEQDQTPIGIGVIERFI
jgi:hypothetical protein